MRCGHCAGKPGGYGCGNRDGYEYSPIANRIRNCDVSAHSHRDAGTDGYGYSNFYLDSGTVGYADADTGANGYAGANRHAGADANSDRRSYANSDADQGAAAHRYARTHSYPHSLGVNFRAGAGCGGAG